MDTWIELLLAAALWALDRVAHLLGALAGPDG